MLGLNQVQSTELGLDISQPNSATPCQLGDLIFRDPKSVGNILLNALVLPVLQVTFRNILL